MSTREDRLFERAVNILEGKAKGLGEPILWHLALRGHGYAMLMLASRNTCGGTPDELGRVQDSFSPSGMTYRLYRRGFPEAAQNMALSRFNIGDMAGYRRWIRLAARAGDTETEGIVGDSRRGCRITWHESCAAEDPIERTVVDRNCRAH